LAYRVGVTLLLLIAFALSATPTPASAQPQATVQSAAPAQPAAPTETSSILAVVNGFAISNYDLDQRMALFLATSGIRTTPDNLPQIRAQVMRSLEDEVIELQEAEKHKIGASNDEVQASLKRIAGDNKMSVEQLMASLMRAGVTSRTFAQQISAQIVWQKLVAARYGADVVISDDQLDDAMKRLKLGADKPQFLLSEIYVAVDRPEDDSKVKESMTQIARAIMAGAPFQNVATQFSQSPSAANGGDIGWMVQGQLPDELDSAVVKLKPDQITPPIRSVGGYYLLLLRARRNPAGTHGSAPAEVDANAALPLDRLLIPLSADANETLKTRAMTLANNIRSDVKSCAQLETVAHQLPTTRFSRLGSVDPKDLDADLRAGLAKTGPGDMVPPYFSRAGLEVIMRCDAPAANAADALPTREELRQQLFMQQMSERAKSYLQGLRRDAVVYGER
jgi:peptidyl-prolyl cis-trans isomerase SurA